MGESDMRCPGCGAAMRTVAEGDVRYESCPSCTAIFLDRSELNALATGMAGDIEFCSVETGKEYPDGTPARACPRCRDVTMKKENLLAYSDVILDYCERCGGWFLDQGELRAVNEELAAIRRSQGGAAEWRGTHQGRFLTVTETSSVASMGGFFGDAMAARVAWRRVDALFGKPLGVGLRITEETWGTRLLRLLGSHDVEVGDAEFDKRMLVQAVDVSGAKAVLGERARKALLGFLDAPPASIGERQAFEVLDDRVRLTWTGGQEQTADPEDPSVRVLFDALVAVADALDPKTTEA